jgi:uncharacterized membrane protein
MHGDQPPFPPGGGPGGGPFPYGHPGFGHGFLEHGHHHGPGPLAWAILAILLAVLIVSLVNLGLGLARGRGRRWPGGGFPGGSSLDRALALLRLRYARGEISRDEYLQASADLGAPPMEEPLPG